MPAWNQSLTLTEPAGLGGLAATVDTIIAAANITLDTAGTALDAAKLFLTGAAAPEAAAASAAVATAEGLLGDLFGAGFYSVAAHPWTPGVGRGEGAWRTLDFPRLVSTLAASFDDHGDAGRPQFSSATPVELLVIAAGAASPAIFQTTLESLAALTGAREFKTALRRLKQAFALEAERRAAPSPSRAPDWDSVTVRNAVPGLAPVEDSLRAQIATLKAWAKGGETAVDIAAALVASKRAQLTTLQTKMTAARALFGAGMAGQGAYLLHVTGAPGGAGARDALKAATGRPGPELPFCAGIALVAPDGALGSLATLLGA